MVVLCIMIGVISAFIGEIGTFYEDFEGGYLPKDIDRICKNLTQDEETQVVTEYIKWRN